MTQTTQTSTRATRERQIVTAEDTLMTTHVDKQTALAGLHEAGYGVIEDGGAVLVITKAGQHGHPTPLYGARPTAATRFDSAEMAARALLDQTQ